MTQKAHQQSAASTVVADRAQTFHWKGTWNEFIGKAKKTWSELTDDDLAAAEGSFQEVIGNIQRKTGDTLESINKRLFS